MRYFEEYETDGFSCDNRAASRPPSLQRGAIFAFGLEAIPMLLLFLLMERRTYLSLGRNMRWCSWKQLAGAIMRGYIDQWFLFRTGNTRTSDPLNEVWVRFQRSSFVCMVLRIKRLKRTGPWNNVCACSTRLLIIEMYSCLETAFLHFCARKERCYCSPSFFEWCSMKKVEERNGEFQAEIQHWFLISKNRNLPLMALAAFRRALHWIVCTICGQLMIPSVASRRRLIKINRRLTVRTGRFGYC